MCGIAGLLDLHGRRSPEALGRLCVRMRDTMVHRGPDDAGVWTALVGGALDRLAAAGAHTATFHSIGNAPLARRQREALRAAGFFQFPPTPLNWIVDGGPGLRREDLADPSRWSFSGLFSDSF